MKINDIINNPYFVLTGYIIGIIGIAVTVYSHIKNKKEKKPCFAINYFNLISKQIKEFSDLEIIYQDKPIDNLTISKFAFWNSGKETIYKNDLVKENPLRIVIKNNYIIYGFEIIFISEESNDFKLQLNKEKKEITITFDYLDYGQGVLLKILHSGNSRNDLDLNGKIIGVLNVNKPHTSFAPTDFLTKSGYFSDTERYIF
jgi:hypothetical protein